MPPSSLTDEVAGRVGSRREARWILEELADEPEERRRALALELAARRSAGEPLQYLLGHWPFRTIDLLVDARALIPRPETEPMVDEVLDALRGLDRPGIVCDLGCGSGAIALSVLVEAHALGLVADVHATDLSGEALSLATQNAHRVGADAVRFHLGSWFDPLPADLLGRIDVVCANPPYVAPEEATTLGRELSFEPAAALFAPAGTDGTPGFAEVESVVVAAASWLAPGGLLLVEHGASQGAAAANLAAAVGLVAVVDREDLAGLPRTLSARRAP
jgi:release factor glutamine methyltransferase